MMFKHEQELIEVRGRSVSVDKGLGRLVKAINRIHDTVCSCIDRECGDDWEKLYMNAVVIWSQHDESDDKFLKDYHWFAKLLDCTVCAPPGTATLSLAYMQSFSYFTVSFEFASGDADKWADYINAAIDREMRDEKNRQV